MHRPKGIIVMAALFALAAAYLCAIATVRLISPEAISLMAGNRFLQGLELAGPYMILLGGAVYGAVAWGLFRLHNWARWIAIVMIAASLVPLVPKISMAELGPPVLWYGLQIALRVAAAWYLAQAPSVIDALAAKAEPRISTDSHG
jgi:hypothetical protein